MCSSFANENKQNIGIPGVEVHLKWIARIGENGVPLQDMSLFITSLNSGSNGNCYYIGNDREAILVDAGISCRETEKRMSRLGLSMKSVKAIFVSHEHTDHIKGIPVIAKKYQLPVYITTSTLRTGGLELEDSLVISFQASVAVTVGELNITAFPKFHDAVDPHSFVIESKGIRIGVFTDIGVPCEQLIHHFQQCHAAFLESNYDEGMLENGSYPYHLKNRIRSGQGHLSNRQALELLQMHRPPFLSHLLLSHLSHNNNCPDLTRALFAPHAGETKIVIASRHEETSVYSIGPVQGLGPVVGLAKSAPAVSPAAGMISAGPMLNGGMLPIRHATLPRIPKARKPAPNTQQYSLF